MKTTQALPNKTSFSSGGDKKEARQKVSEFTSLPKSLKGKQEKAEKYILMLEKLVAFRCGERNPYLQWIREHKRIDLAFFFSFIDWWYWLSRYQPQTLWKIISVFPNREEQEALFPNAVEESGLRKKNHQPHWWHLEQLTDRLGGRVNPDPESEQMLKDFLRLLDTATPAKAIGYIASIEFPGLLISEYFTTLIRKIGREDLVESDFYIKVHTTVEFEHIIKSAGSMLLWINDAERQKKYGYEPEEIVTAFQKGMDFWQTFWARGFEKLGYSETI